MKSKIFLCVTALNLLVLNNSYAQGVLEETIALIDSPLGSLFLVLATVGGTLIGIPSILFIVAAAVVFGPAAGFVISYAAVNLAAWCGYLTATLLGEHLKSKSKRFASWQVFIREHGFMGVLILRVVPIMPFTVLNYAAGILHSGFISFASATAVGVVPVITVYSVVAKLWMTGDPEARFQCVWLVIGLNLVLGLIAVLVKKRMKRTA